VKKIVKGNAVFSRDGQPPPFSPPFLSSTSATGGRVDVFPRQTTTALTRWDNSYGISVQGTSDGKPPFFLHPSSVEAIGQDTEFQTLSKLHIIYSQIVRERLSPFLPLSLAMSEDLFEAHDLHPVHALTSMIPFLLSFSLVLCFRKTTYREKSLPLISGARVLNPVYLLPRIFNALPPPHFFSVVVKVYGQQLYYHRTAAPCF